MSALNSILFWLSEEVVEVEHELNELRKHISAQGILVQGLMSGVCRELDEFNGSSGDIQEAKQNLENCELEVPLLNEAEGHERMFLENVDVLLAEHKVEEALEVLDTEERSHPELKRSGDTSSTEPSSYKSAFLKRREMLEDQLVEITEQPSVGILELKKALSGLLKLGKGPWAHQLLLKSYGSHLQNSIKAFLPFCHTYAETYSATLSNLVFSSIALTTKESGLIFGDNPAYTNRVIQWAEREIESFVRLVKENAPPSDTIFALHAASICVQASLSHCSALESQGLRLSKLLLVLLRPYIEEVLELNFRRARRVVLDIAGTDESLQLSPRFASPLSIFATSCDSLLIHSGMRFIFVAKDIVEQLTPLVILHFGGNILTRISQLFDKYADALIRALPGPSEDDNLTELKEAVPFRVETDSEQLALLGTTFTVADELLPMLVSRIWSALNESKEAANGVVENILPMANNAIELKDWRRHLQHSLDKLRDHFCRQYVLNFIYSRDGEARLDAQIYLHGKGDDLIWDSNLPSLPFQDIVEQLTPLVILHFGGNILTRISQLFDKYADALIRALPGPSEDDNLTELKEAVPFRVETDSEQLALLGTTFTVADELLPMLVSRIWSALNESKEAANGVVENILPMANNAIELKDWRRHLQHSLDQLRDHFCRQYVLNFIYSRDGEARLDAQIYLHGKGDDLIWDSNLPSLPFQALFGKLQQLATVAGDVLLGKERIQKILLARLTETVVMWLSDEQEF
ncbi:hypothetical protein TEA_021446 [Camellia sinensis var. sinensis]|uniref:Exocyst component Exo84 C-terminal domain-containing protein n=1 Tax=Camellia sinensis var. sinensis TaxID=542762 RepID=A0A4S4F0D3_CAMSN|nr:hypothetical protein TEA_021446 [Camellia sinensis var. sinensis]